MSTSTADLRITCPDWCAVTKEQHIAELDDWEGRVVHMGDAWIGSDDRPSWILAGVTTWPDGTPEDRPLSGLHFHPSLESEMKPAQAEDMARAILAFMAAEREAGR